MNSQQIENGVIALIIGLGLVLTIALLHHSRSYPTEGDYMYGCEKFFGGELQYLRHTRTCVVNGTAYELIYYPKNDSLALGGEIPW